MPGCGHSNPNKSTEIAQTAAEDAKKASDSQTNEAEAAAACVRIKIAQKAVNAALAAEAALAGKLEIVQRLEGEEKEAVAAIKEVSGSLQSTRVNAELAASVADSAQLEVDGLQKLIEKAMQNVSKVHIVSAGAQAELVEKMKLLTQIRNQYECLCQKLQTAKQDVVKTKKNAYKAACAALEATARVTNCNNKQKQ